jgi:hypothetical protein
MSEKRKNDQPRRFQWWLLALGFALGVALTLALSMRGGASYVYVADAPPAGLWMTATSIVQEATNTALDATAQPPQPLDPILATATAMVLQATQAAQAGH